MRLHEWWAGVHPSPVLGGAFPYVRSKDKGRVTACKELNSTLQSGCCCVKCSQRPLFRRAMSTGVSLVRRTEGPAALGHLGHILP